MLDPQENTWSNVLGSWDLSTSVSVCAASGERFAATMINGTTFVINAAPFYSGSGLAIDATTINHGFALKHYDLVAADRHNRIERNAARWLIRGHELFFVRSY